MAETPPPSPGSHETPPDYSGHYPRDQGSQFGSAEKLRALSEGYFGLNWVFLLNVVMALAARGIGLVATTPETAMVLLLCAFGAIFLVIAFATYPYNKKIAFGKGWEPSMAILASILMGLNSALCCGIIGYVVMQQIAYAEMKKYGLKGGFFGLRKKDIEQRIAELQQMPAPQGPGFHL